jgi:hypothetical protein
VIVPYGVGAAGVRDCDDNRLIDYWLIERLFQMVWEQRVYVIVMTTD